MLLRLVNRILGKTPPPRAKSIYRDPSQFALPLPAAPRILILKLDHIGDMVLGMRAIAEIRNAWPSAGITLVCSPTNAALAEGLGLVDKVLPCRFFEDRSHIPRPPNEILAERFRALQLSRFDIAIDLRFSDETRFLLDHVDAQYTCGFFTARIGRPLDISVPLHEVPQQTTSASPRNLNGEARLLLLTRVLIDSFQQTEHPIHALVSPGMETSIAHSSYAVLSPACGAEIKQWPNEHFAATGRALVESGLSIVLVGGEETRADCAEIARHIGSNNVRDLSGALPLERLPNVLHHAQLFIGNDSGPGHMAAALGVPTVVIFSGAVNADVWHPRGLNTIALKADIECSPCYKAKIADCPNDRRCLTEITPEIVVAEVLKLRTAAAERGRK
jgi:ADP-heptose:LPS heptosyltransferase